MYTKRLLRLSYHLEFIKPEYFNLGDWKCGTVCCAVGHAAQIKEFTEAGFTLESMGGGHFSPRFEDEDTVYGGWRAVQKFFGIDSQIAYYLFQEDAYPSNITAFIVAARIRRVTSALTMLTKDAIS